MRHSPRARPFTLIPIPTASAAEYGEDTQAFTSPLPLKNLSIPYPKNVFWDESNLNYEKLAYAISCAETACGKDGTAKSRNNCCGIMRFWVDDKGVRQRAPKTFEAYEDSLIEAAALWKRSYGIFPTPDLANKWTGGDNPTGWLATVTRVYYTEL